MGLSSYVTLVTVKSGAELQCTDEPLSTANPAIREIDPNFAYWYGFDWLHLWAEELYADKADCETSTEFNENNVELVLDDLVQLTQLTEQLGTDPLRYAVWQDVPSSASVQALMDFLPRAKEALNQGQKLYFSSWY